MQHNSLMVRQVLAHRRRDPTEWNGQDSKPYTRLVRVCPAFAAVSSCGEHGRFRLMRLFWPFSTTAFGFSRLMMTNAKDATATKIDNPNES